MVSALTPTEVMTAARRLAGARPHLAAIASIVHHEDLWQLCRDELAGVDVRIDGWDIRGRCIPASCSTASSPRAEASCIGVSADKLSGKASRNGPVR
jgi:hypothetical protein